MSEVHRIHCIDWLVPANMRPVAGPQECCDICTSQSADNPPCALGVERFRIIDVTALKVCFLYSYLFIYSFIYLLIYLCIYLFIYAFIY